MCCKKDKLAYTVFKTWLGVTTANADMNGHPPPLDGSSLYIYRMKMYACPERDSTGKTDLLYRSKCLNGTTRSFTGKVNIQNKNSSCFGSALDPFASGWGTIKVGK